MKVTVKGSIRDLLAFRALASRRRKRIAKAPATPLVRDAVNDLARRLHPDRQNLVVLDIQEETKSARTFRLGADPESGTQELAYFRAGQYLSIKAEVEGVRIARPYSISSAPFEALGQGGSYEITIKKKENGFLTQHIWTSWTPGTKVVTSGPNGFFYHEPMRDSKSIIGLAGGSGITPFRSMAREIVHGGVAADLTLLYGSSDEDDVIFYDEFRQLEAASDGRIKVVFVLSCEEVSLAGCDQGFITADTIRKHGDVQKSSFFICGPQDMYRFVTKELGAFDLRAGRIRREAFGELENVLDEPGFPRELAEQTYRLGVHIGGSSVEVPARANETLLVAMERSNLAPPSQCRSGECGFCRSLLVSGDVYVRPETDGRRGADKRFGHIHPCASYPIADIEIKVPRSV